jgi:hypothetical protein
MFSMIITKLKVKQLWGGIVCLLLLSSCIKLQEKNIKFDINCPACIKIVVDSVYSMRGIHYVNYDKTENTLKIKYDTANFSIHNLNFFLTEGGYVKINQDSSRRIPACCR